MRRSSYYLDSVVKPRNDRVFKFCILKLYH
ncbi:MAG TPA: hypothetical protein DD611_01395 [Alphaproteobacteria bacterium]|nr:hypothetical protein [Alphaproteobacteria bacterium]